MIADLHKEGKSLEEITARMKEALAQIRHPKADRPVFPAEFLARLKRVIVFRPLDGAAMGSIARKAVEEIQQMWQDRRGKRLDVPHGLIQYVGEQAHLANERAGGKEGGRIVRKLLSDWIEGPLQRQTSQRIDEYRASASVRLEFVPSNGVDVALLPEAPKVSVFFEGKFA
jgi:ATP-dependent Clp protease ATP-binding subunit ClpA